MKDAHTNKRVFVIMGVSGSGKTSVGQALAQTLAIPFHDGDDFHPPENVAKMAGGTPLTDADRWPWLTRLHDLIADYLARGESAVIACSALKQSYRAHLRRDNEGVCMVHLHGSLPLIQARMAARQAHFMKPEMLRSQFEILETPSPHDTLIVSVDHPLESIVQQIIHHLQDQTEQGQTE